MRFKIFTEVILLKFLLLGSNLYAQQVYDYVANSQFLRPGVLPRPNWYANINTYPNLLFASDGDNIFYVMNSVGDATFESYNKRTTILEPTDKDTFNSQLIFVRYSISDSLFTTKTFGSNYLNMVLRVKMDEQSKSIAAIVSTCGDTVRLNPDNPNEILTFKGRQQRYWLVVFDINGKLLSKYCLAESAFSTKTFSTHNLGNVNIGKYEFGKNIILSFAPSKSVINFLPVYYGNGYSFLASKNYVISYNQKKSNVDWLRKILGFPSFFDNDLPGIQIMLSFDIRGLYKYGRDTFLNVFDENNKLLLNIGQNELDIDTNSIKTLIYFVDEFGNFKKYFDYRSQSGNQVRSIIKNSEDILLTIGGGSTVYILGKEFTGNYAKVGFSNGGYPYSGRFLCLKLRLDSGNTNVENLFPYRGDSIAVSRILKAKNGFFAIANYDESSTQYNILAKDTLLYKRNIAFYQRPKEITTRCQTLTYFDSAYNLKWSYKTIGINSIVDNGKNIIIDYVPRFQIADYNFRYETIGRINPEPMLMVACVHNCKPLAFFDTLSTANTMKFVNHSEYNSNYKWSFGDEITTSQRNPTHVFGKREEPYKIQLIVSNSCGTDTFIRYYYTVQAAVKNISKKGLKIYPNPITENRLFIEKPIQTDFESIQLFNTLGQELPIEVKAVNNTELQIQIIKQAGPGVYYLKIYTKDNGVYLNKLIVK